MSRKIALWSGAIEDCTSALLKLAGEAESKERNLFWILISVRSTFFLRGHSSIDNNNIQFVHEVNWEELRFITVHGFPQTPSRFIHWLKSCVPVPCDYQSGSIRFCGNKSTKILKKKYQLLHADDRCQDQFKLVSNFNFSNNVSVSGSIDKHLRSNRELGFRKTQTPPVRSAPWGKRIEPPHSFVAFSRKWFL